MLVKAIFLIFTIASWFTQNRTPCIMSSFHSNQFNKLKSQNFAFPWLHILHQGNIWLHHLPIHVKSSLCRFPISLYHCNKIYFILHRLLPFKRSAKDWRRGANLMNDWQRPDLFVVYSRKKTMVGQKANSFWSVGRQHAHIGRQAEMNKKHFHQSKSLQQIQKALPNCVSW